MSDQETTDNFFKAWKEWLETPAPPPVFFRLYYGEHGEPLFYSMEDLPGNYIEIDQPTYARNSYLVRVVDGQLIEVERTKNIHRLRPDVAGTPCDPRDVCVVVSGNQPHISWKKSYES